MAGLLAGGQKLLWASRERKRMESGNGVLSTTPCPITVDILTLLRVMSFTGKDGGLDRRCRLVAGDLCVAFVQRDEGYLSSGPQGGTGNGGLLCLSETGSTLAMGLSLLDSQIWDFRLDGINVSL